MHHNSHNVYNHKDHNCNDNLEPYAFKVNICSSLCRNNDSIFTATIVALWLPLVTLLISAFVLSFHFKLSPPMNKNYLPISFWILMRSMYDFPCSSRLRNPLRYSATPILLNNAGLSGVTRLGTGPIILLI